MQTGGAGPGRLWALGIVLVVAACLCAVAGYTAGRIIRLNDTLHGAGMRNAQGLAATLVHPIRTGNADLLQSLAQAASAADGVRSTTIVAADGRVLAYDGPPPADASRPAPPPNGLRRAGTTVSADGLSVVAHAPILDVQATDTRPTHGARILGWVALELPRTPVRAEQLRTLFEGLAAVLLLTLAGALAWRTTLGPGLRRRLRPAPETEPAGAARASWSGSPAAADAAGLKEALSHERTRALELERARRRAVDESRAKTAFLAQMSHEIRTPMNSVLGYCALLLQTRLNPVQREFAQTIESSAQSLLRVIDGVLSLSRSEVPAFQFESTDFDIRECIENALALLAPRGHEKDLELACLISPHVPARVRGDPDRIRQVLINLVGNAVKFTDEGSVVVRCVLTGEDAKGLTLLFSVSDTGIGIDEERCRGLFRGVGRSPAPLSREREGNGLGLAISRELVHCMDGEMGVESIPDTGSTFWFTVRCERCAHHPQHPGTPAALKGRRALLYERRSLTRAALRETLAGWDMAVHEVGDPAGLAVTLAADEQAVHPFDVLILDLSGHEHREEVLSQLRTRGRSPVLALLSSAEQAGVDEVGRSVNGCVFKPVRHRELQRSLTRLLRSGRRPPVASTPAARPRPQSVPDLACGLRVLVVEDNEINRKLMVLLLRSRGVRVSVARDGAQALQHIRETRFDAILMDLYMPGIDGVTATRRIREAEVQSRTPIIGLTAEAMPGTREKLLACGMDDYLVKPVREAQLWEVLRKWSGHPARKESAAGAGPPPPRAAPGPEGAAPQVVAELYGLLLAELPERRRRIDAALREGDLAAIREEAHALAGVAACCAVPELKRASEALERTAAHAPTAVVTRHVRALHAVMERLLGSEAAPQASPSLSVSDPLVGKGAG
jgi:two-component system sensor histidine kinase BarA